MSIVRTYPLKHSINIKKQKTILKLFKEYQKLAHQISNNQWVNFFQINQFNKNLNIIKTNTKFSARYKQTNQYQVVGQLESYISNRQNEFKTYVYNLKLDEEIKKDLYIINKLKLWFSNTAYVRYKNNFIKHILQL